MATNLPSRFLIQFLEQHLKFLVNFTLLKYVKSQRSYSFLITKELIFGFRIIFWILKRSLLSLLKASGLELDTELTSRRQFHYFINLTSLTQDDE